MEACWRKIADNWMIQGKVKIGDIYRESMFLGQLRTLNSYLNNESRNEIMWDKRPQTNWDYGRWFQLILIDCMTICYIRKVTKVPVIARSLKYHSKWDIFSKCRVKGSIIYIASRILWHLTNFLWTFNEILWFFCDFGSFTFNKLGSRVK